MPVSPCNDAIKAANRDPGAVARANAHWGDIEAAANAHDMDPALLAAIGVYESNFRLGAIGDHGHGHGVYQMDDRWNAPSVIQMANNEATNPAAFQSTTNLVGGRIDSVTTLFQNQGFSLEAATMGAVRAYNAGHVMTDTATFLSYGFPESMDYGTANHNYVSNVMNIAANCF